MYGSAKDKVEKVVHIENGPKSNCDFGNWNTCCIRYLVRRCHGYSTSLLDYQTANAAEFGVSSFQYN